VMITSCAVLFTLANFWDRGESVVTACAFAAAVVGNLQAFVVYPFFNAFYRTGLLSSLNFGETATSFVCGALAFAQSPAAGIENFTAKRFFVLVLACSVLSSLAWTSLGWQKGYRKEDAETEWALEDGAPAPSAWQGAVLLDEHGAAVEEEEVRIGDDPAYGATADSSETPLLQGKKARDDRLSWNQHLRMNQEVMRSGGAVTRGARGIALPVAPRAAADGSRRPPRHVDGTRVAMGDGNEGTDAETGGEALKNEKQASGPLERARGFAANVVAAATRNDSEVKWLLPLATVNTVLTWSVVSSFLPYAAAAASGSCLAGNRDVRAFIRSCTSLNSMVRVFGPLCVRIDGKRWGHPVFVRWCAFLGICLNATFCVPALFGPRADSSENAWNSDFGRASLRAAYAASTPFEPFTQLHLLLATHRENKRNTARIIDAGFAFAALVVTLSFGAARLTAAYAATGTAACRSLGTDASSR